MTTSSPVTRLCRQCGEEYPLDQFRRKSKDSDRRETNCRDCHRTAMKEWRRSRTQKALKRFAKCTSYQLLDRRLRALASFSLRRLGGAESLARMLVEEIKSARDTRPGDRFPLHAMTTILRLHEYVDSRRKANEPADNFRGLTDDELKANLNTRMQQALQVMIQEHPQLAVNAAASIGWIVIPPKEIPYQT